MRRLAFLLALPLIGLAGFVLSFYSPNATHAGANAQATESSDGDAQRDACERSEEFREEFGGEPSDKQTG